MVVATSATRVELEIAGERVVVENWPEHFPEPPGPVDVSGERWKVGISSAPSTPGGPRPSPTAPVAKTLATSAASSAPAGGIPVIPPMPGRVVEVRVKEGERVGKGDVLLVLEAMKMRNEVASPMDGVVRGLRVSAGTNARAREPMLFISNAP